jgi:hypothetical protein
MNSNKQLTKSAKRRLRVARRLQQSVVPQNAVSNGAGRKRRRNRNRQRKLTSGIHEYLRSLIYPEGTQGVKIPDETSFPSGTFQITSEGTLSVAALGDTVALLWNPDLATAASFRRYNSATPGAIGTPTDIAVPNLASLQALYARYRPVSGSIVFEYIGSTQNDNGYLIGSLIPNGTSAPTTVGALMSTYGAVRCPIKHGLKVIWKPVDNSNFEYHNINTGSPNDFPYMMLAATGLASSTTYIMYRMCMNYESIPNNDTLSIVNVSPSPVDEVAMKQGMKFIGEAFNSVTTLDGYVPPSLGTLSSSIGTIASTAVVGYQLANLRRQQRNLLPM